MAARAITSNEVEAGGPASPRIDLGVPPLLAWVRSARSRYAQHRLYRETVAALAELDDRILADIGIGRHEIHEIARAMSRKRALMPAEA
jgi:uncharacterized protein YjiS (DUF1127 family)